MDDAEEKMSYASSSMKATIFDGSNKAKYQDWADDIFAILQYHDLEEYVEVGWKGKNTPSKTSTDATEILQRKEMKKEKSIFIRATKELPNMIVKEDNTPYEAYEMMNEKYSVKKIRDDFDTVYNEWNEFKVTDVNIDPDLVYKTLEEQSKKFKVFGARYEKDALQMLSKLKYALPKEYNHVFVYLNTNEESNKSYDDQLATSKAMINSHYKTDI